MAPVAVPTAPLVTVTMGGSTKVLPAGSTSLEARTMGATDSTGAPRTAAVAPLGTARASPAVSAVIKIWLPLAEA